MNYLLDTHTLLWVLFDERKLTEKVRKLLLRRDSNVFISSISLWEISLKYAIGKLDLKKKRPDEIPAAAQEMGFNLLDLNAQTTSTFFKLPIDNHKDPFDLMLAWQAIKEGLVLVSCDKTFSDYEKCGLNVFW